MFDGTTESLVEEVSALSIQRETRIATFLAQYERELENAALPDQRLLQQAQQLLQEHLQERRIDCELAHLAVVLSYHLADWMGTERLLSQYRRENLATYETAWAWWHQVDFLALSRNYPATVKEQRALISWGGETLPPVHRLFTISDTTQALSWLVLGEEAEWFYHCQRLLAQAPLSAENRFDRFLALRSMLTLALRLKDQKQAEAHLAQLEKLVGEDPAWERCQEICMETLALHLSLANLEENHSLLCTLGEQAWAHYTQLVARWETPTVLQRRCLRRLAHNLGAECYEGKSYEMALPLFEQAVRFGATTPWTYLWFAGCVWTLHQDEARVSALLQQARSRDTASGFSTKLKHLAELAQFPSGHLIDCEETRVE